MLYSKIIAKLMDYNERINSGKEISVIEYMKRINHNKPFLKSFENQKNIRTAFYEEFKICGFNYILLLFESVVRMLATMEEHREMTSDKGSKQSKMPKTSTPSYYSKNYMRLSKC